MKNIATTMLLIISVSIYAQKAPKMRVGELDSLTVSQNMFDDMNFVMAFPYLNQLQINHPEDDRLKYMTGICCLFREEQQAHALQLLQEVYKNNKNAEDIEYYLALAFHYNNKFEEAIDIVDIYLKRKLTKPQIRSAEKLKEFCLAKNKIVPLPDEGKLDDYVKLDPNE